MVTYEAVKQGIASYFEQECARKATGIGQFAAYFMAPSIPVMVGKKMDEMMQTGLLEDIFVDGMVDLDTAANRARDAMNRCGSIEIMGFRLNTDDVNNIANYIRSV